MNWLSYLLGLVGWRPTPKPPTSPDPPDPPPIVVIAGDLVEMLNRARSQQGVPPVSEYPGDMQAAQMQAGHVARRDRPYSDLHAGPVGYEGADDRLRRFGVSFSACGEIAASGYPPTDGFPDYGFDDAIVSWLKSPGHRAILLGPWSYAGAAIADAASGRPYAIAVFHR